MPTWGEDWGGLWGVSTTATVLLPDTVWFGDSATGLIAELATDESQNASNMTTGATWHYELSPATRFKVVDWTIDAVVGVDNTDTGRMFRHGALASSDLVQLRIAAGGIIEAVMSPGGVATTVASLTLPSISGSDQDYLISWSCEANPLTTGASNAYRTELRAWNLDTGEYTQTVSTHAVRAAPSNSNAIWWADSTAGGNPFTGTPYAGRFSTGFHHSTTVRESFVSNAATPVNYGETRKEIVVPPKSSGIGDDSHFAGPLFLRAALDTRQRDLWLAGPLVNEQFWDLVSHDGDRSNSNATWTLLDPDLADRYLYVTYLYRRPVPPSVNKVSARVFFQQWRSDAPAAPDEVHMTLHSMSQPGPLYKPTMSPAIYERHTSASGALTYEHGSGATAGAWVELGPTNIARDSEGFTYLCLGFRIVDGSSGITRQFWRVKSLVINPVFETQSAGAFA